MSKKSKKKGWTNGVPGAGPSHAGGPQTDEERNRSLAMIADARIANVAQQYVKVAGIPHAMKAYAQALTPNEIKKAAPNLESHAHSFFEAHAKTNPADALDDEQPNAADMNRIYLS